MQQISMCLPPLRGFIGAALLGLVPGALIAQDSTVDEGSFTISQGGTEVGTETFSIRSSSGGDQVRYVALARLHVSGPEATRDLRSSLEVRSEGHELFDYQVQVAGDGQMEVRYVRDGPARLRVTRRTPEGVLEREMRAPPGVLVLDQGVAHHFHFLGARVAAGEQTVSVLIPSTGRIVQAQIAELGTEAIEIGSASTRARHVRVTHDGGTLNLWYDSEWRLLRAEGPQGYQAERTALP